MKLNDHKEKIDKFFAETSAEEIIDLLKKEGFEFESLDENVLINFDKDKLKLIKKVILIKGYEPTESFLKERIILVTSEADVFQHLYMDYKTKNEQKLFSFPKNLLK